MLHTLRSSQDSFQHSFTVELVEVVYLSTMQFGSLLSCLRRHLRTLSCSRVLRSIHPAQSYLLTCSRKLQSQGYVWIEVPLMFLYWGYHICAYMVSLSS